MYAYSRVDDSGSDQDTSPPAAYSAAYTAVSDSDSEAPAASAASTAYSAAYTAVSDSDSEAPAASAASTAYSATYTAASDSDAPASSGSEAPAAYGAAGSDSEAGNAVSEEHAAAAAPAPAPSAAFKSRDWMGEYVALQRAAQLTSSALGGSESLDALSQLFDDFCQCAVSVAALIVRELQVPVKERILQPVALGGVAGGSKYIVQNILYKLAEDAPLASGGWMYGGDKGFSIANANKACGHELKSMDAVRNAALELRINELHTPLAALVDYRGYRMVAMALLPVHKKSLVLGSNDGGVTVNDLDPEARQLTERVCKQLGLLPHLVAGVMCPGPGDLEVHRGRDNVIYMLDFARLFPPEHRANAHLKPEHRTGHEIFYQLLRPELVRANPRPLCSDALSGWGRHDPNFKQHNADLREACERMRTQCVIECASILDAASLPDSSSLLSPATIRSELHRAGLGMRLLGLVRAACTNMTTRTLLLTEMVRRCLVCAVREQLRVLGDRAGFGFSALFTRHVHALLDTLLGGSLPFWRVQVREMVEAKYGVPLHWLPTDAGAAVWQNDASRAICVPVLIRSLSESWGFDAPPQPTVTAGALIVPANGLISMPLPPLVPSSMQPERFLAPRLKFSNFAHLVRGRALLVRAQQLIVQLHYTTARHFLDAARESLSSASASAPFNSNIASDLLHCMLHQALLLRSDARILAQVHVDSKRLIQLRVATDCMMCAFVAACTSTYQKALTALRPMQAQAVAAVTSSLVETLATWDHVFSAHGLTQRWRLVLLLLMVRHAPMEPDDRATYLCALLSSLLQFEPRMGNFSSIVSFVEELWTTPTDADLDARMIPLVGEQEWRYGRALRDMLHELLTQCKPAAAVELRSVLLGLGPARLRIVALHVLCVSSPVALTMGGSGDNDDDDGGRSRMFQLVDERLQDAPLDAVDAFLVPIVSAAGFAESTEVLQSSRNVCAHLSLYRVLRGLVSDVHLCSAIVNARAVYPFGAHVPSTQLRSISHSNLRASTHTAAVMTFLARAVPGAALLTRVSLHGDTLDVSALPLLAAAPKLAALKLESFSLGNGDALTALLVARNTTLTELDLSWCSWDAETEATLALPLAFPHLHTVILRHLERAPKPLVRVALATARKVTLGGDWTGLGNPLKRCARVELLIFMDLDGWLPLVAALSSTHLGTLQQLHFRGSSSWQCHEVAHADALVALVTRVPALLTLHIDPRLSGDGALALALRLLVLRQWNAFSCEALRVPADHALWPAATALRVLRLGQRSQMSAAHYLALVAQATELRAFKVSLDRAEVQLLAPIYEGPACQHLRLVELHENIGSNPDAQVQALLLACPRLTTLGLFEVPNITEACLVEADEASFARLIRVHLVCFSANSLRLLQTVLQRSHTLALRHLEIAVTVRTEAEGDAIAVAAELVSARGVVVDRNAPYYFIPEVYDEFIEQ